MGRKSFFDKGIKFECQGSGNCCSSRGSYGYVYLTKKDRKEMAVELKLSTAEFTKEYCIKVEEIYCLKEDYYPDGEINPDCRFLKDNKCMVYKARPTQCRTWPFWPENMTPRAWNKNVVNFCPGAGKGKVVNKKEILDILAKESRAEDELLT